MAVLRVGSFTFQPHLGAIAITLLAIAIMVKLGLWQIDRGLEKQAIIDRHADAEFVYQPDAQTLIELTADTRISVRATLDPERYFLIDNQIYSGRAGYHVLVLASAPEFGHAYLPVNLGWIAAGFDRSALPHITLPSNELELEGRIRIPSNRPFLLQEQVFEPAESWPVRIQFPELDKLREGMQLPLLPVILLLDEDNPNGFARDWPVVVMEPQRHYAYAVQWFGLSIAAFFVFLFASRVTVKSDDASASEELR